MQQPIFPADLPFRFLRFACCISSLHEKVNDYMERMILHKRNRLHSLGGFLNPAKLVAKISLAKFLGERCI